jgi:hypothetical protein
LQREYSSITNNRFLVQLLENELKIPQVPSLNSNNDNNNNKKKQLQDIINEYEINKRYAQKLQILQDFKIVFILDDSGSMNTPLKESPLLSNNNNNNEINLNKKITRWDELHYFSNIMLEIANFFNPKGCDVYFLNRNSSLNVKDKEQLSRLFSLESPQGFTPLTSKLNEALNDNLFQLNNRKLLIIIITDGEPTDSEGTINIKEFKDCLLKRPSNVYTTIAACTDDDLSVEYLNNWDKEIPRLGI